MNTKSYTEYKPVRYPGQLREVVGDAIEQNCTHVFCDACNGTGWVNKERCPGAIACDCPKCAGLFH